MVQYSAGRPVHLHDDHADASPRSGPNLKRYLPSLTGIRVLAALWILLFHLNSQAAPFADCPLLAAFAHQGFYGVDLFFVLSGFIISHTYFDLPMTRKHYSHFLRRRIARIYPLHLVMLLLLAALIFGAGFFGYTINRPEDYTIGGFIAHLFMVSAWTMPTSLSWNHFAWAVSAEWLAYMLFPAFIWLLAKLRQPVMTIMILGAVCPLADLFLQYDSAVAYAPLRVLCGFGIGIAVYQLYQSRAQISGFFASFALLLGIVIPLLEFYFFPSIRFTVLPVFGVLIYALAGQDGALSRLLSNRFFQYGGRISYALFITQFVVVMIWKKIFLDMNGLELGMEILTILGFAMFCYHLIEEPARKYLTR